MISLCAAEDGGVLAVDAATGSLQLSNLTVTASHAGRGSGGAVSVRGRVQSIRALGMDVDGCTAGAAPMDQKRACQGIL